MESDYVNQFVVPSSILMAGIVGMPNSGKSSLFNLLTKQNVSTDTNMFCTIDPNMATVDVIDERLEFIRQAFLAPVSKPNSLTIIDTAGIVEGSHMGKGVGNQMLDFVASCDVVFHVVRAFDDESLSHDNESVDPVRDIQIVNQQVIEKDLQTCIEAIHALEVNVVRGFDGLSNNLRFQTLLKAYHCLKGLPYELQKISGAILRKQIKESPVQQPCKNPIFSILYAW